MIARSDLFRGGLPFLFLIIACSCTPPTPPPQSPPDVEFVNSSSAGLLAYDNGDFSRAQMLYGRALTRARAINAADSIADAASNLALCEINLKHYEAADRLLREAEYDAQRASANLDEIHLLRAKLAYLQGHLSESADLATQVIGSTTNDQLRLAAMILKGQISCDGGNLPAAKAQLQAIDAFAATPQRQLSSSSRADIAKLRGTIASLEKNAAAAASLFEEEANLLRTSHRYGDMSHALARAAESYLAVGKPGLATDRYFLAARSIAGQGDSKLAKQWLTSSISAAERAGDMSAAARSGAMMKEITEEETP